MVLRMDSWRGAPDLFPNVLTALVTAMSIALVSVLLLLGATRAGACAPSTTWPMRWRFARRWRIRWSPACARATCKAASPTSIPAFCDMVGFSAEELLGQATPAPYWPPELADEYQKRQEIRLSGQHAPPREGYESVFMRKDGSRFPVLIIEAPLINHDGLQTGWMSAFLDISEQRRVQELSRASQERLQATARLATVGEMASLLSHELNQPLAAISSYATGSMNLLKSRRQRRARCPTSRSPCGASPSRPSVPAR